MAEFVELKLKLIYVACVTCMTKLYPRPKKSHRTMYRHAAGNVKFNLELGRASWSSRMFGQ